MSPFFNPMFHSSFGISLAEKELLVEVLAVNIWGAHLVAGEIPMTIGFESPGHSATPIRTKPPPRLWKSFAKAHSVCSTRSGFH
jgi:hypothetical protein